MSVCDSLSDAEADLAIALNSVVVLDHVPEHLPDSFGTVLDMPLRSICATHPEAVTMLRQRLSILENARQFGSSVKLEARIARTRAVLDHAEALAAAPTREERIGECLIRDDAEAGHVVIRCGFDLTPEMVRRIRMCGFVPSGRTAKRPRKIVGGENFALETACDLVRSLLGG